MEPVESTGTEAAPSGVDPAEVASPELIAIEIVLALLLAGLLAVVQRWTLPAPPLLEQRERPPSEVAPEAAVDIGDVTERTAETFEDERPTVVVQQPLEAEKPAGVLALFQSALGKSRAILQGSLDRLLGRPAIDPAALEDLEEALLRADVGVPTTDRLLSRVREVAAGTTDPQAVRKALRSEMKALLEGVHAPLEPRPGLWVILVVGVNGSGKTTTIGKLAARLKGEGRKVLLAAGDTFRAAAEQQLTVWAERAGVDIVALEEGADPAAVAYRALERAKNEGHDVVIVDTAGRLQTRKPLMEQLGKIRRVIDKALPGAPHETLLVLDGTIGQNGLSQAKLFHEVTPITGVVITKLDGTAKGGMVLAVATELGLPVKLVGLGERVGDLRDFDPDAFVDALI